MVPGVPTPPRRLTMWVALLVLIALVLAGLSLRPAGFGGPPRSPHVSVEPAEAVAGSITMFTITVEGGRGGRLAIDNATILVQGGLARADRNWTFEESPASVGLLVSPFATALNLTIHAVGGGRPSVVPVGVLPPGPDLLVDGTEAMERERAFTDTTSGYVRRITGHPNLERSARFLEGEFRSFGLETRLERYPLSSGPLDPWGRVVVNVVATKWGADRSRWIVFGAHFDSAQTTVEGAYDDGQGTNMVVTLAHALSKIETNHTLVFALFSGEEEGLQGSEEFVKGIPKDVTVTAMMNHDMVGLNWPAPFTFHALIGQDEDEDVIEHPALINLTSRAVHGFLGLPPEEFNVTEHPRTRSDHVSFWSIGAPTVNFKGGMDAYPGYHTPQDTFSNMVQVAGGEENLRQSLHNQAWISLATALLLDDEVGPL